VILPYHLCIGRRWRGQQQSRLSLFLHKLVGLIHPPRAGERPWKFVSELLQAAAELVAGHGRDGQEAVWVAQQHQGPIHTLVTDLGMPRLSGQQLAELLVQARPHLRVLFMSGYTDEAVLRHGGLEAEVALLQKPFNAIGLARKVRDVLDAEQRH
jgi:CheY-like chemotaxis protein